MDNVCGNFFFQQLENKKRAYDLRLDRLSLITNTRPTVLIAITHYNHQLLHHYRCHRHHHYHCHRPATSMSFLGRVASKRPLNKVLFNFFFFTKITSEGFGFIISTFQMMVSPLRIFMNH